MLLHKPLRDGTNYVLNIDGSYFQIEMDLWVAVFQAVNLMLQQMKKAFVVRVIKTNDQISGHMSAMWTILYTKAWHN